MLQRLLAICILLIFITNLQCKALEKPGREFHARRNNVSKQEDRQAPALKKDYLTERPFKEEVTELTKLPLEERIRNYFDISRREPIYAGKIKDKSLNFTLLIIELVLQRDFEGIEEIENQLPRKSEGWKKIIYREVDNIGHTYLNNTKKVDRLLSKWALSETWCVFLFQFHPNGKELLLNVLESNKADIYDRLESVDVLVKKYGKEVIPILKKYEYDKTKYKIMSPRFNAEDIFGLPDHTLGDSCRMSIFKLKNNSFSIAFEYLNSDDPDAVDQSLNIMFKYLLKDKLTIEEIDKVIQCITEKLLSSKEPIIQREAIEATLREYPEILKRDEGLKSVQQAIEEYNRKKKKKAEELKYDSYSESYLKKDIKGKWVLDYKDIRIDVKK